MKLSKRKDRQSDRRPTSSQYCIIIHRIKTITLSEAVLCLQIHILPIRYANKLNFEKLVFILGKMINQVKLNKLIVYKLKLDKTHHHVYRSYYSVAMKVPA